MKQLVISLIRIYQKTYPFHIGLIEKAFGSQGICRFSPTCSEYTIEAIQKKGVVEGVWMGLKRFSKCHPWSKGGFDPVK
jgi:putative membrane protein insertion efficiency factor